MYIFDCYIVLLLVHYLLLQAHSLQIFLAHKEIAQFDRGRPLLVRGIRILAQRMFLERVVALELQLVVHSDKGLAP